MTKIQIFNPVFQYYPGDIRDCKPTGWITLLDFIRAQRSPKDVKIFAKIAKCESYYQECRNAGDHDRAARWKEVKSWYKRKLNFLTPCVHIRSWRNNDNIIRFTGLAVLDFDHLTLEQAAQVKEEVYHLYSVVVCCWFSPSKHGVKALMRIPIVSSVDEFHQYYEAIINEFQQYPGFDTSNKNSVLPLFRSYDPDILYREGAEVWDIKADPPPEQKVYIPAAPAVNHSDADINWKSGILWQGLKTAVDRITDNHHVPLRNIARTYGGYCPRYLNKEDLIAFLDRVVDGSSYMKADAANYKRTIRQSVEYGMTEPQEPNIRSSRGDPDEFLRP